jgi:hypothetical protein
MGRVICGGRERWRQYAEKSKLPARKLHRIIIHCHLDETMPIWNCVWKKKKESTFSRSTGNLRRRVYWTPMLKNEHRSPRIKYTLRLYAKSMQLFSQKFPSQTRKHKLPRAFKILHRTRKVSHRATSIMIRLTQLLTCPCNLSKLDQRLRYKISNRTCYAW